MGKSIKSKHRMDMVRLKRQKLEEYELKKIEEKHRLLTERIGKQTLAELEKGKVVQEVRMEIDGVDVKPARRSKRIKKLDLEEGKDKPSE